MLRPERRLLIAEKETKGYEWADTYLEQTRRGILPQYYPGKEGSERDVLGKGRMRLPKQMIFRKRFCHYKQACGILPR